MKAQKKHKKHVPYKLSYLPAEDMICFIGDVDVLRNTRHIKGLEIRRSRSIGEYGAVPATRENFMVIEALGNPASINEKYAQRRLELMRADEEQMAKWNNLCSMRKAHGMWLKTDLMPHQHNYCAMAYGESGILNGSEQGTGKTGMAIAMWQAWLPKRGLIVCPKSLMWQWASEFHKFLGDAGPDVLPLSDKGVTVATKKAMVEAMGQSNEFDRTLLVVNYEILDAMMETINKFWKPDFIIFDESWKIKSPTALVTQAAIKIADKCIESWAFSHVQLLSGTPIGNDVGDLWSQMKVITTEPMDDYDEWMARYAIFRPIQNKRGHMVNVPIGCKDPVGLMQYIAPKFFRATKATCLNLPEKVFDRITFDLPPAVQKLYERTQEIGNQVFDTLSLSGERVTKLRLQQITGGSVPEIQDITSSLRGSMTIESPKRDWMYDFAGDWLKHNPSDRCIIWCKFNAEIEVMTTKLREMLGYDAVFPITRHTHDRDLEEAKRAFNAREENNAQIFVAQIKKLAYGHNLQAGDWNILFSHPWSYIDRDQLEDRTHRMGREGVVRYIELVVRGTYSVGKDGERKYNQSVDEEILEAVARKENLATRLGPDTVGDINDEIVQTLVPKRHV